MKADKRAKRAKQKTKAANLARQREQSGGFYGVQVGRQTPRPPKFNPDDTRVDHLAIQKLKDYGLWEQMQRQSYANQNSQLIADDGCIFFWICNENGHSGYSWFHNVAAKQIIISRGE
jgi:hypothetical protein